MVHSTAMVYGLLESCCFPISSALPKVSVPIEYLQCESMMGDGEWGRSISCFSYFNRAPTVFTRTDVDYMTH